MEQAYIEVIVKSKQTEMNIQKIVSIDFKPALNEGENFMSTLLRYKLTVILGSGETATKHVLVKSLPDTKEHSKFLQEFAFFKNEINMYSKILRDMKALMEEFEDRREILWCEMVGYKPYHKLILEDLKDLQYYGVDRKGNLDLDHAFFAIKNLARFHALSATLLKRCLVRPGEFDKFIFCKEKFVKVFFVASLKVMEKAVRQSWGAKWSNVPPLLKKAAEGTYKKLNELVIFNENRFNVINHGDCWTNNFLFKHVEDTNIPCGIRFVDFQLSHCNSFGWDLTYFLYTSLKPTDRRQNYNQLLACYHKALQENLKFYNYPEKEMPTLKDIEIEMKRLSYFGFNALTSVYAITTSDIDVPFDMEKNLRNEDNPEEGVKIELFTASKFRDMVGEDIKQFIKEGVI